VINPGETDNFNKQVHSILHSSIQVLSKTKRVYFVTPTPSVGVAALLRAGCTAAEENYRCQQKRN